MSILRRHPALPLSIGLAGGFLVALVLLVDPFGWHSLDERLAGEAETRAAAGAEADLWTCPMHPEILEDDAGQCPICFMDLVPLETGDAAAGHDHAGHDHGAADAFAAGEELWTCPMHPEIVENEEGPCPICGMDLVPLEAEAPGSSGGGNDLAAEAAAAGRAVVRLDAGTIQKMNVTTAPVRRESFTRPVRGSGSLAWDPERVVTVTTRVPGFVERARVHRVGERVRRGQPLFDLYSPELVQTQEELVRTVAYVHRLEKSAGGSGREAALERARGLVEAARRRLERWEIPEAQIRALEEAAEAAATAGDSTGGATDAVRRTLTIVAPASGVLVERLEGLEGSSIGPGTVALRIADPSRLLADVEVYENQLPRLGEGTPVTATVDALPGRTLEGRVRTVEPTVDPVSRTGTLVVEVDNRDGRLRPGMYATVLLEPPGVEDAVTVPSSAVLHTGRRQLVVVALGDGRFAPREVTTGLEADGRVQVLSGLAGDEEVVTSAQFLIDSESNLRAAIDQLLAERRAAAAGRGGEG